MYQSENVRKQQALSQSLVFKALDDASKQELVGQASMRRLLAGETIFTMGSPGESMIAIAEGTVRISMPTPNAQDIILAEMGVGEVFGEIALLDGGERSANATALTKCTLVVVERRALVDVLQRNPELSVRIIRLLCQRIRRSDERMVEMAFLDLPARIARTLLRLTIANSDSGKRPLNRLSLSQAEIASMVGGSRENVNRCLRKWQRASIVDLKDGWITLVDRDKLKLLADGED